MTQPDFRKVLEEAQETWMDIEGVVSVAQGKKNQQDCIDVYIALDTDAVKEQIPDVYKTFPVVIRNSGGPFVRQ